MTRSEKIHFTKNYSGKENVLYLALYKAYQNANSYQKIEIEKGVKRKWPNKNIRQATIYLESAVMNALALSLPLNEHAAAIQQAEKEFKVFRQKGMLGEFHKTSNRLLDLHRNGPTHLHFIFYLYQTSFLNIILNRADKNDEIYIEYEEAIEELPQFFKSIKYYFNAYRTLIAFNNILSKNDIDDISQCINEVDKLILITKQIAAKQYLYEAKFLYHNMLKQYNFACEALIENINLFESNEKYRLEKKSQLNAHYLNLLLLIEYYEHPYDLAKVVKEKIDGSAIKGQEQKMLKFICELITLKLSLKTTDAEELKESLNKLEFLHEKEIFPFTHDLNAYVMSMFASINFQLADYNTSLDWIDKFEKSECKNFRKDIHVQLKFLFILNHFTIGNDLVLPYAIKNTYRYLSKNDQLNVQESWMLSAIKKINKFGFNEDQIAELLNDYKNKIAKREFHDYQILDIEVWLKSLINKNSYLENVSVA